jgi:hypothetical protein
MWIIQVFKVLIYSIQNIRAFFALACEMDWQKTTFTEEINLEQILTFLNAITVTFQKPDIWIPELFYFQTYLCPVFEWSLTILFKFWFSNA